MRRTWAIALSCAAAVFAGACGQDTGDDDIDGNRDQERLQALLRDAPLNQISGVATAELEGNIASAAATPKSGVVLPGADPLGVWDFDDCNPERANLADSFSDNTAFRSVDVACTTGVDGTQAVAIAATEDIVYVPDQPDFTFESGVTVAGWFRPDAVGGLNTLFRKRDKGTSSFALMLNSGRFELIIAVAPGVALSVTSPRRARTGVFQHVAGTYDGTTARLYVDGLEVNSFSVPGSIPRGPGPLLMGNDGSERRFDGTIDSTLFATHALTAEQILGLTCVRPALPTVALSPSGTVSTPAGVPTSFDLALTNTNSAVCGAQVFDIALLPSGPLDLDPRPFVNHRSDPVPPGATGHFAISATPAAFVSPGTLLTFRAIVSEQGSGFFTVITRDILVADPDPDLCVVDPPRELMITSTSVVDDPLRTRFLPGLPDPRNGVWTFKHLVENLAPSPAAAPAMVEAMLAGMATAQVINGFTVAARPSVQGLVLDSWPRTSDGALDLAGAPLRLQAIVNRFDLRNLAAGDAGEGRFVFAFERTGLPLQATIILEYKLPAATPADVLGWANAFHDLGALPFGESYNAALQVVTQLFVARGARPGAPNGSAINAVRTNELTFGVNGLWELREFRLSAATGLLEPVPVELTPDRSFNNSPTLASFINTNQAAIIAEQHTVPPVFQGQPFQGGAIFNDLGAWFAPGVDPEARHHFSLNTCNGCHSAQETGVPFLQISPRFPGAEAGLSGFLTGTTISDPLTGQPRVFNDLLRRRLDLEAVVCGGSGAAPLTLGEGIRRVH